MARHEHAKVEGYYKQIPSDRESGHWVWDRYFPYTGVVPSKACSRKLELFRHPPEFFYGTEHVGVADDADRRAIGFNHNATDTVTADHVHTFV